MDKESLDAKYRLLQSQYEAMRRIALKFADELCRQIEEILVENQVSLALPIESRLKEWDSIAKKIERKISRNELKPDEINDLHNLMDSGLHDLIGLRLILLFKRDVDTVGKLLTSNFIITERENTLDRLQESQFGYGSVHYIVEFHEEWLHAATLSKFPGLKAEVQVRTAAQHIWAAASHLLQYKQEAAVPLQVKRAIHRVSALLETVDLEFERVLLDRDTYKESPAIDLPSESLNADSLAKILDELLPGDNKSGEENYADLLQVLLASEPPIDTPIKLKELIIKHKDTILSEDKKWVQKHFKDLKNTTSERNNKGVFYSFVGLVRLALSQDAGDQEG